MTGIYIHVPFCERKCPYCAFYSVAASNAEKEQYYKALRQHIISSGAGQRCDTVYFGGGTPPLIGARRISGIIETLSRSFELCDPEITVECNPNSILPEDMSLLRESGVNRLSVGVQSLDDEELRFLGRLHDSASADRALNNAVNAGFENISADLMIGIRGQTAESLRRSTMKLCQLGARHISVYMIKAEQGTAFCSEKYLSRLMDDDEVSELYLAAVQACEESGFKQYEISNFAFPGFESRHNLKYWRCEEYLGFGPSAHSFLGGMRYRCANSLQDYISDPEKRFITDKDPDKAEEYVLLGLRLCEGISLDKAFAMGLDRSKASRAKVLCKELVKAGMMTDINGIISLTPKGMLVSNSIISELLK